MTTYKKYLYIYNDNYFYKKLKPFIGKNISKTAFNNACNISKINIKGVNLNDKYNETIAVYGKYARVNICNPPTLFAPYAMTYDPDIFQTYPIGWPIKDEEVQNKGYQTVIEGKPSCISFYQNNFLRKSPYTSHCSAYLAWITQQIFGISLVPTQIGDWCHAAAEQRDIMYYLNSWWCKTDSVSSQYAANNGKLAIAVKKINDPDREGYEQNGHIAIILPINYQIASELQKQENYPKTPIINDEKSFKKFIKLYGPEISQSGGLNFSHTVCANGFSNYYGDFIVGETPIDDVVEFYIYKLYTQNAPNLKN